MPEIKKGSTDVTRYVMVVDATDGSPETSATITNFDLQYTRYGSAAAAKVDATALGSVGAAHDDNKMIEVDATSSPGLYRVDWPDAAFADGAEGVILVVTSSDSFHPAVEDITLVDNVIGDALDANDRVDVGSWLGTAVTLSAGAPDVNLQSMDDIDLSATMKASVNTEADNAIETYGLDHLVAAAVAGADVTDNSIIAKLVSKSATADWDDFVNTTDSLQALRDHYDETRVLLAGTSTASSTVSQVYIQAGDPPSGGADDDYNDMLLIVWRGTDKSTARVNVRLISDYDDSDPSFTLSSDLEFTPQSGDLVEVVETGAIPDLGALTGGFGTTSPNRLVDHLRAMMSKAASTPGSVGTYDPATDSLEHIGESLDLMAGAGFATGTDSLKKIRDAIDTLVAPSVVSSSALSGSGFLSDCVSLIRKATDEPGTTPKYTDGDIVELLQVAIDQVLTDIAVNTDHPIIVRHSISIVSGEQDYILPPQVGELHMVTKENTSSTLPEYEVWPGSHYNPARTGWKIEGNVLRLLRDWQSTETLTIMYSPNAEPLIHKATASAVAAGTVTFPTSVTDGTLGTRPNEYVGMIVRILESDQGYKEERLITAYDVTTRVATLNKDWDTTPTGTVVYEVVPVFGRLIKHVVSLRAAIDLLSQEGNSQRMSTLERNYMLKLAAMRRAISKKEGRFPHHFDGDTWDNENRADFFGYGYGV